MVREVRRIVSFPHPPRNPLNVAPRLLIVLAFFLTGYDTMSPTEQAKVRRMFSEANHQVLEARRARIEEAHALRRSRIMQEAGRLMAESRNLQRAAMLEGIPLGLPLQPVHRRERIIKPDKGETEISKTKNLAHEIASLISDIENTEKEQKSS